MTVHFVLGPCQRHDRNVWFEAGVGRVTDPTRIAELEAEYRRCQQALNGYHHAVTRGTVKRVIQAVKHQHKTPREWRGAEKA